MRRFLVPVWLALIIAACGSSSSTGVRSISAGSTRAGNRATAPSAIGGDAIDRFPSQPAGATARLPSPPAPARVERAYVIALFDDMQGVWRREFAAAHVAYKPAHLVVFWSKIDSACGYRDGSGPFYCPGDERVYLDTRFLTLLLRESHVGVAAQAYIMGHEFGHHVQRLLGIEHRVDVADRADPSGRNARSVRIELQADCLAGVWASSAYPRSGLHLGDLYEALKTAHVIGDDYLMHAAGKLIDSSQWTHGSSQQRQMWLRTGFRSGRPSSCDTFKSSG